MGHEGTGIALYAAPGMASGIAEGRHEYTRRRSTLTRPWFGYGVAVLSSGAALGITFLIDDPLVEPNTLLVFMAAVMCTSWVGGLGPGLVATALSALGSLFFYMPPQYSLRVSDPNAAVRLAEFIAVGILISVLNHARRRSEERAHRARAEAEAANHAKDNFLAMVSHDLRTPLSAIAGWTDLLREHLSSAAAAEVVERIGQSVKVQAHLIEDLLDISRISAGRLSLEVRPIHLRAVIERVVEVLRPAIDGKRQQLTVVFDPDSGIVSADPDRLQQVLWNLLSNAVKFTADGGTIELSVQRTGSYVTITVSDTGGGIAPEVLPHIFEPFRQGDASAGRGGGLGLGLSIARYLVELHGGTIRAQSDGKGRGSAFTVQLPAVVAHLDSTPAPRSAWMH